MVPEILDKEPFSIAPERLSLIFENCFSKFTSPPISREAGSMLNDLSDLILAWMAPCIGPLAYTPSPEIIYPSPSFSTVAFIKYAPLGPWTVPVSPAKDPFSMVPVNSIRIPDNSFETLT